MGKTSKIQWTDYTWSPWIGCSEVSPGCANCYARDVDKRFFGGGHWGKDAPRRFFGEAYWKKPLSWNRKAKRDGVRRRVFPSICDPLDIRADTHPVFDRWLQLVELTPWLDWLLLTKRPENLHLIDRARYAKAPLFLPNLWPGVTTENQTMADLRIPQLQQVPAAVRFVSVEPQLELVNLGNAELSEPLQGRHMPAIHWVICGCESGPKARPFDEDWPRSLRDQCQAVGAAYFFKQSQRDGKLVKMPALDGRVWDEMPERR